MVGVWRGYQKVIPTLFMPYTNPILPGFYPDPSICRSGEDYYLVTSTFEYFPGVPIFHSRDLTHWRQIGHCLNRDSQLDLRGCKSSGGIYAPTIRYHQGRFYMITTNRNIGNGDDGNLIVWTDDPASEWSEPIWVNQAGIDPSLLFDDDGTIYFTNKIPWQEDIGIRQSVIDLESGQRQTDVRKIWSGTGGSHPEGPHLYKMNGFYYLMVAEGGTGYGHMETVARSESPWGPFEPCPYNPILCHSGSNSPIQCTGHADLIEAHDGRWWAVFLGVRTGGHPMRHHLGRETFLAPVSWTDDGWPLINHGELVTLKMTADALNLHSWPQSSGRDDFDNSELGIGWNFRGSPKAEHWSLEEHPGCLTLTCAASTLRDPSGMAFIGRRQQHFECIATASLHFRPGAGDEAGLTVLMDERHHYEIFVSEKDGQQIVALRLNIGPLSSEIERKRLHDEGGIELRIQAKTSGYEFLYRNGGDEFESLGKAESRYLTTEVAGGFTGVYLGMYATGNGSDSSTRASFDWFDYKAAQ